MIAHPLDLLDLDVWLVRERSGRWMGFTTAYPHVMGIDASLERLCRLMAMEIECHALTDGHDIRIGLSPVMLEPGLPQERFAARYRIDGRHVGRLVVADIRDASRRSLLPEFFAGA